VFDLCCQWFKAKSDDSSNSVDSSHWQYRLVASDPLVPAPPDVYLRCVDALQAARAVSIGPVQQDPLNDPSPPPGASLFTLPDEP
jgi:hypothetical protein